MGPATLIRFDPLATIFYDRRDLGKGGKVKAYRSTTTSSTSSREEKKDNPVCMRSEESGRAAGCVSEERRRNGEREPSQECVCFRYSQHNHVRGGGMGWKGVVLLIHGIRTARLGGCMLLYLYVSLYSLPRVQNHC